MPLTRQVPPKAVQKLSDALIEVCQEIPQGDHVPTHQEHVLPLSERTEACGGHTRYQMSVETGAGSYLTDFIL